MVGEWRGIFVAVQARRELRYGGMSLNAPTGARLLTWVLSLNSVAFNRFRWHLRFTLSPVRTTSGSDRKRLNHGCRKVSLGCWPHMDIEIWCFAINFSVEKCFYFSGKKSFLSTESDTVILQSLYFAYKVGIISSAKLMKYK